MHEEEMIGQMHTEEACSEIHGSVEQAAQTDVRTVNPVNVNGRQDLQKVASKLRRRQDEKQAGIPVIVYETLLNRAARSGETGSACDSGIAYSLAKTMIDSPCGVRS